MTSQSWQPWMKRSSWDSGWIDFCFNRYSPAGQHSASSYDLGWNIAEQVDGLPMPFLDVEKRNVVKASIASLNSK